MFRRPPSSPLFPTPPPSRSPAITAEQLSKTFRVKVRGPGLRGAIEALLRPRYRDVHAVREVTFRIDPGEIDSERHRSEEHTSELQSPCNLVCRLLLEKKKNT